MSPDIHELMTAMTHYYRWLIGAMPLTSVSSNNDALQAGALVRNWHHSHVVDLVNLPSIFPDALRDSGSTVEHNIIAWNYSPRGVIAGWIDEGYNLSTGSSANGYQYLNPKSSATRAEVATILLRFLEYHK